MCQVVPRFFHERGYQAQATAELPDKAAAVRAGWGLYGKNTIIHAEGAGSYLNILTVLTDAPLEAVEQPLERSDCGECEECVRACPTGALAEPYHLRADRCICDWLWGSPIPRELRPTVGNHLHRCSFCQDVCPKNRSLRPRTSLPFALDGPTPTPELIPLLGGTEELLRASLPSFVMTAGAETIRRNVALALGNVGDPVAVPALAEALADPSARVREYAAWALGEIGGSAARTALAGGLPEESEPSVREEIAAALDQAERGR